MAKLPDLPKKIYHVIDEYYTENGRPLTYLQSEPIPELPLDILRIIGEYVPPVTKEDLFVLFSLDPTGKVLEKIFKTTDKNRIAQFLEVISMPESTEDEINDKLDAVKEYYPVIYHLYQKLKDSGKLDDSAAHLIFREALRIKDFKTALEITEKNKKIALDPDNIFGPFYGEYDHETTEFLIDNFLHVYLEADPDFQNDPFEEFLLKDLAENKWFDLMAKVIKELGWEAYIADLVRYPELEKTFIEIVGSQIEKPYKIETLLEEIKNSSTNPEHYYQILRNLGVSNDFIEEWKKGRVDQNE